MSRAYSRDESNDHKWKLEASTIKKNLNKMTRMVCQRKAINFSCEIMWS